MQALVLIVMAVLVINGAFVGIPAYEYFSRRRQGERMTLPLLSDELLG